MWKRSENIKKFHNDSMSKMSFWTLKIKLKKKFLCAGSSESKFYIAQCTCLQDQPSKCYYRELGMTKPSSTQQILVFSSPTSTTQAALRPQPNTEDTDSCNKWRKANHIICQNIEILWMQATNKWIQLKGLWEQTKCSITDINYFKGNFSDSGSSLWNSLPSEGRCMESLGSFKHAISNAV